jgi:TRAP-type transport system periplasmic protein
LLRVAFVVALLAGGLAFAAGGELKLGHAGGHGSIQDVAAQEFAQRFGEELAPQFVVRAYGNSVLGNDTELLKKLKTGEVSLAIVAAPMSSVADEFGIFDMPFLVRGRRHVKRFRDTLLERHLQPAALAKGYRILALWEFGVRHVTNNMRPIKVPSDLKGLKFRTPNAQWRIRMLQSYGVEVTRAEIKDIYASLQSGTLDGLEMPLPVLCSLNIHKEQKYLSLTHHLYSPAFLVVDEAQFQRQPAEVREALIGQSRAMQDWVLERGQELDEKWLKQVKTTMVVNEAERVNFTLQALPIYRMFIAEVPKGKAMIKLIYEADPEPFGKWGD